jgi:SAM-dependent methyltransferase
VTVQRTAGGKLERWRRLNEDRVIPTPILAAAPEPPFGFSPERFALRTRELLDRPPDLATRRALEALPGGGTVLDVGVGTGSASLCLVPPAPRVMGVDISEGMLARFVELGSARGAEVEAVHGAWPDVADAVPVADVVVCHSVLYGVADLEPFAGALTSHARRRVVTVIPDRAWLSWMDDLWNRFHGLRRSPAPTAGDAADALRELGLPVHREDRPVANDYGLPSRAEALAEVRRRLCLWPRQDGELAQALGDRLRVHDGRWVAAPMEPVTSVTLWWDTGPV